MNICGTQSSHTCYTLAIYTISIANTNIKTSRSSPFYGPNSLHYLRKKFFLRVTNDSGRRTKSSSNATTGKSEADEIVDGVNFGQLCNEFECISSPSIEATARQLARDILELRQGNRALGTFAVSVKYKVVTFTFISTVHE
ncbi:hypothetical protein Leryth_026516 [Lithospermum erythrorhizon]|uniref:Uncharacterized protein n=1 Tax=Lithospermum erythrorhizon TaxID=34254 RepID=A0AAV3Q4C1_LITER|nr:hypothetical protein Leryth_026516 [Lithospermum erythrorhizon]